MRFKENLLWLSVSPIDFYRHHVTECKFHTILHLWLYVQICFHLTMIYFLISNYVKIPQDQIYVHEDYPVTKLILKYVIILE